jgi:hypothetical protein
MLTLQLADIPHQGLRERMTDPTQHRDLILEYVDHIWTVLSLNILVKDLVNLESPKLKVIQVTGPSRLKRENE